MYDFLCANGFTCHDMAFRQNINYTHFQFTNNVYSWIDHIFTTDHCNIVVDDCVIIDHDIDNVSDHLPILTKFKLRFDKSVLAATGLPVETSAYARPKWDNYLIREKIQ